MKILSLFDGMSCGMLALNRAKISVDRYVAYEIDKYAIQVSSHNFPMIEHRGDVFEADFTEFEGFDFVIGGSPCTYWSIAQKKEARETEAHGIGWNLFQQYARAIREAKPRFFVYENNKSMAPAIRKEISETFGFEPILINSALVSAQKRERLYWVGIRNDDGTYRRADIRQPADRGILLKDVIDGFTDREKGRAVISSAGRTTTREYFKKSQGNMVAEPVRVGALPRPNGELSTSQALRIYDMDGKSVSLKGNGGGQGGKTGLYAEPVGEGAVENDNLTESEKIVYTVKDGKITIKNKIYPIKLPDGQYNIRKLTVEECKRLQTVPEGYDMSVISDTQAYKCLGNGWTVDVIAHIFTNILGGR